MAKSIDNVFNLVLLDELVGNSVVLAISMYYVIMNLEISEIATSGAFTFFGTIALVILFGYCLIGDQLVQQCISVQEAYYQCNWYEMPLGCRKCLLIYYQNFHGVFVDAAYHDQKDLDRAAEVLSWNKRLMSMLGLWPFKPNTLIFSINFSYFSFLMILEYLDLLLFTGDLEHVIMNLTENMAFSQIFVRMSMLRLYNAQIGEVITEAMKDFDRTSYKTAEEVKTVMTYNTRSKVFVKLLMTFVALTASSYYLTPIIIILGSGGLPEIPISENVTQIIYLLPYRFHLFYAVESMRTYTITYALQMPFVFVSGFGQSAADCIMVTLVFHICGQMSVLALRINNIDTEVCDCKGEVRHVVRMHIRLLRMGQIIGKAFSVTLLAHLVGATSLVCILGYQILTIILPFLLILYAHCTVGENLLTESAKVCQAFYDCHWYNMSKTNARMIILCMARSQKPLCLTAGKFTIFCLSTLTDGNLTAQRIFSIGGIWPFERSYVRFAIYILHYAFYLVMAYVNFYDVFGNLELMVMNLVETVAYSITFPLVCLIRCSDLLKLVIDVIRKDMVEHKFENIEEERIYYNYNFISKVFSYGSIVGMFITVVSLYFRPLVYILTNQVSARNSTESFMLPYRVHPFLDTSNTHAYILMYLYLFPLIYISVCHMAAICLLVILVFHICGELSILSYRIRHVGEYSQAAVADRIRSFVRMHLKIIW
ncbi:putative odorant receptor 13a [Temnothorax longispinosus]|uniref:Putative odorant receptor 13a n=1 Tax=Temnothorax longispinosus TaxID=300112 RepID=A0A4S2L171_9HYME|nr:putative odorant receptor 13a [Temnothorax longispinosus]